MNTNDIFTRKVQYDGDGTPSANRRMQNRNGGHEHCLYCGAGDQTKNGGTGLYVWYEIDNFYQNHNRYMTSFSMEQLLGTYPSDDRTCKPLKSSGDKDLYPCGVIANSMFNDVITLENEDITMRENNLAWARTTTRSSRSPRILNGRLPLADISGCLGVISTTDAAGTETLSIPATQTSCSSEICQADLGSSTCFGYVCRGGDFDGGHCVKELQRSTTIKTRPSTSTSTRRTRTLFRH